MTLEQQLEHIEELPETQTQVQHLEDIEELPEAQTQVQNQVEAVKYFCDSSKYRGIAYFYQRRPEFSHELYL